MDTLILKSDVTILRTFQLPFLGKVLVHTGQHVSAGEVLATLDLPERFQVFDILNNFKVEPERLEGLVKRLVGEPFKAGDIIAQKPGLFSRIFRASQDGKAVSLRDGKITLALGNKQIEVKADLPGCVMELVFEQRVTIGTQGSLLQGVWGNGKSAAGLLTLPNLVGSGSELTDKLAEITGSICFVGNLSDTGQFQQVLAAQPHGLIFAAIPPAMLSLVENLPIPVLCLVGFGDENADPLSLALLEEMKGSLVYLRAGRPNLLSGEKPELILPKEDVSVGAKGEEIPALQVGSLVRLLGKPYHGSLGTVVDLPELSEQFASGLSTPPLVVKREDGEVIHVPRTNVLLILN